jgi:hypothetical protein
MHASGGVLSGCHVVLLFLVSPAIPHAAGRKMLSHALGRSPLLRAPCHRRRTPASSPARTNAPQAEQHHEGRQMIIAPCRKEARFFSVALAVLRRAAFTATVGSARWRLLWSELRPFVFICPRGFVF